MGFNSGLKGLISNQLLYTVFTVLFKVLFFSDFADGMYLNRSRWRRGIRCVGLRAARFLGLRVQIPPEAYLSVSCECYVLSGRRLCDGPIPRLRKIYWFFVSLSVNWCSSNRLHLQWLEEVRIRKKGKAYLNNCRRFPWYCSSSSMFVDPCII